MDLSIIEKIYINYKRNKEFDDSNDNDDMDYSEPDVGRPLFIFIDKWNIY